MVSLYLSRFFSSCLQRSLIIDRKYFRPQGCREENRAFFRLCLWNLTGKYQMRGRWKTADRVMRRIREAFRKSEFDITGHAVEEMTEDGLHLFDLETSILGGWIFSVEKDDPRGTRYTIYGIAEDGETPVGSVGRFTETGRYLVITVYRITEL